MLDIVVDRRELKDVGRAGAAVRRRRPAAAGRSADRRVTARQPEPSVLAFGLCPIPSPLPASRPPRLPLQPRAARHEVRPREHRARCARRSAIPSARSARSSIAGTNGKGSVTVMVETALRAAGHRTARYTSPHLVRLEERFVIDGREVETGALRDAVATRAGGRRVADANAACSRRRRRSSSARRPPPSSCSARRASTSRCSRSASAAGSTPRTSSTPIAAAITSIDFDHQAQLGDTLEAIAREKAGIIKPGIPVVCGPLPPRREPRDREIVRGARGARVIDAPRTRCGS